MPEALARWLKQSPMSDPRNNSALYDGLPRDLGRLCEAIQGVLLHADWASAYGLADSHLAADARATLPLQARLAQIAATDARPLDVERPVKARAPGTCRDYALMLCSVLRYRHVPSRVRCGFAAYFSSGPWEDHWICEYWQASEERWRRVDAQLDGVQRRHLDIRFDATDVPATMYLTAGDAWRLCRSRSSDAEHFGHGTTKGLWFVGVNVIRDHYALNESEVSPWDSWRQAGDRQQIVSEQDLRAADHVAERPEAAMTDLTPPWLV